MKNIIHPNSVPRFDWKYEANTPEKPLRIFPGSIIKEVKSAYCVAVNCFETRLVKNAIFTVPTTPAEKLSVKTIIDKRFKFGSRIATTAKRVLDNITANAPKSRDL